MQSQYTSQHPRLQASLLFLGIAAVMISFLGAYGAWLVFGSIAVAFYFHFKWPGRLLKLSDVIIHGETHPASDKEET